MESCNGGTELSDSAPSPGKIDQHVRGKRLGAGDGLGRCGHTTWVCPVGGVQIEGARRQGEAVGAWRGAEGPRERPLADAQESVPDPLVERTSPEWPVCVGSSAVKLVPQERVDVPSVVRKAPACVDCAGRSPPAVMAPHEAAVPLVVRYCPECVDCGGSPALAASSQEAATPSFVSTMAEVLAFMSGSALPMPGLWLLISPPPSGPPT